MLIALCVSLIVAAEASTAEAVLPPPRHGGVYVVAHRGAYEDRPENTLAAYQRAIDLGVDYVEIDIRTTKDGHLVSIHNSTVDAYTEDASGAVRDFTLAELKALDIGSRIGPEWKEERIPTYEEILDLCKGRVGIYLDVKDATTEALLGPIRARGMEREVIWYAGRQQLEEVREQCPECIPMPDPGPEENLAELLETFQPRVVASLWRHLSPEFVEACRAAGVILIVDERGIETWAPMLEWGVDGIQTDHPEALIQHLRERAEEEGEPE